jgi:hypothetical protein
MNDGHDSRAAISAMRQPIELHPLHPYAPAEIPTHFIGCSIAGTDIPALEGVNLRGENLLINIDLGGETDIGKVGGFWGLAQKATIAMMQLKHMHQDENLRSITISTPIPFPKRLTEYLKEFTDEHFPGKPVFTTLIPHDTEMVRELNASSIPHPATNPSPRPLCVTLNTHTKVRDLDALDLATFVLSPEVKQIAAEMGAVVKTKPPLDSEIKDKSQQTFAEKMASRTTLGKSWEV